MNDKAPEEIRETDIVFLCPYCGKSLVIDERGAGLLVECPDCGQSVQVPEESAEETEYPAEVSANETEGPENQRLEEMRQALAVSQQRVSELSDELREVRNRRGNLERQRAQFLRQLEKAQVELTEMRNSLDRLAVHLQNAEESET